MSTTPAPSSPPPTPKVKATFAEGQAIGHSKQFTILRVLGRGGFGEVFLASEERAQRRVAIKTMLPEHNADQKMLRRFKAEYTLGSLLSHPSLVQMYDLCVSPEGVNYIVMEFIDGEVLSSLMARQEKAQGQLGLDAALHVGWQMSSLLEQLHQRRTIHRDLKPGNIMVVSDPATHGGLRYKLIDFGIAKLLDSEQAKSLEVEMNTTTGMLVGTPNIMSPESIRGGKAHGPASDVYALGCMLYRCIAGKHPFRGSPDELMKQHLESQPTPLTAQDPGVPREVEDIIHKMLEKDPTERPTMAQVAEFFARALGLTHTAAAQVIVRGGTKELQAVLADFSTGSLGPTESAAVSIQVIEGKNDQGGPIPAVPLARVSPRRIHGIIIASLSAAILGTGAAVWRSQSGRGTAVVRAAPAPEPAPALAPPPSTTTNLNAAAVKPVIQPAAVPPANPATIAPAPERKHKKKKRGLLVHDDSPP